VGRDGEGYIADLGQAASDVSEIQKLFWGCPGRMKALNRRFDPKHGLLNGFPKDEFKDNIRPKLNNP
jgi:hypothetical protein